MKIEEAENSDLPVYLFLDSLLELATTSTEKILEIEQNITELKILENRLTITSNEVTYYKARGITSRLEEDLPPFIKLGEGLKNIAEGQRIFLKNFEVLQLEGSRDAYLDALRGVKLGRMGIEEAKESVETIKNLSFYDSEGRELRLNTEEIEKNLERLERIFTQYEKMLEKYSEISKMAIVIYASKETPYLFETVEIYGYAFGVSEVKLHIISSASETEIPFRVENERFIFATSFKEVGAHKIFATSGELRSNTLILNVSKIPTFIIADGGVSHISENFTIHGSLQDYKNNPLSNKEVIVDGEKVLTDHHGNFEITLKSDIRKTFYLDILFLGDEIYEGSKTSVTVIFYGDKLNITLSSSEVPIAGKEFKITGYVDSEYEVPLEVYVDGKPLKKIHAMGDFYFNLSLEAGNHQIFAVFNGDERYEPAKSNVLQLYLPVKSNILQLHLPAKSNIPQLHVYSQYIPLVLFIFVALTLLSILLLKLTFGRKIFGRKVKKEEKISEVLKKKEEKEISKFSGIRYRELYFMLTKLYGLKKSLTPRELLKKLENEPFIEELKKATIFHERSFYGMKRLQLPERRMFLRAIRRIIQLIRGRA